jgi:DNA invertase Pin-like site-specific DNA recombinase
MKFGYGRVSTDGQTLEESQIGQLKAAGCTKIFSEKQSGAKTDGPELAKLLKMIKPDDIVIITRLDRLARSTRDLLKVLHAIGEAKATFRVLDNPALDSSMAQGRLLIEMLAAIAAFERDLILARTNEGRKRAIANGVKMCRKPKLDQFQRKEAIKRRDASEPVVEIARSYKVSHSTICRL